MTMQKDEQDRIQSDGRDRDEVAVGLMRSAKTAREEEGIIQQRTYPRLHQAHRHNQSGGYPECQERRMIERAETQAQRHRKHSQTEKGDEEQPGEIRRRVLIDTVAA